MTHPTSPFLLLVTALSGWLSRQHQTALEYLKEENRILRSHLGKKRLKFTDAERRRLVLRCVTNDSVRFTLGVSSLSGGWVVVGGFAPARVFSKA